VGADAILLIVAILDDAKLKWLHDLAVDAGLRRSSRCTMSAS
jgi:indole-3-glycerol phosphate synthase